MNKLQQYSVLGVAAITSACAPVNPNEVAKDNATKEMLNIDWDQVRRDNEELFPNSAYRIAGDTAQKVEYQIKSSEIFLEVEKKDLKDSLKNSHKTFLQIISKEKLTPALLEGKTYVIKIILNRTGKKFEINVKYDERTHLIVSTINPINSSSLGTEEKNQINEIMAEQDQATNEIVRKVQAGEMAESDL